MPDTGYVVSFEGISGAGKTSVIEGFMAYLRETKFPREVVIKSDLLCYKGEDIGKEIKDLLDKHRDNDQYFQFGMPAVETCLILAKRAFESQTRLLPKLRDGAVVLADRDIDTVCALQLVAWDAFDTPPDPSTFINVIRTMNSFSLAAPALTFYFDVSIDDAMRRVEKRDGATISQRDVATWQRAKEYYRFALNTPLPGRTIVEVDTSRHDLLTVLGMVKDHHATWLSKSHQ